MIWHESGWLNTHTGLPAGTIVEPRERSATFSSVTSFHLERRLVMVSLAERSRETTQRPAGGNATETTPPVPHRENGPGRKVTTDPLSMSIVHDLRNPLAAICGCAEMLTEPDLSPDHAKRLGRNIHIAAGRMRGLLADLVCVMQGKIAAAESCNLYEILVAASEDTAVAAESQRVDILLDVPLGI